MGKIVLCIFIIPFITNFWEKLYQLYNSVSLLFQSLCLPIHIFFWPAPYPCLCSNNFVSLWLRFLWSLLLLFATWNLFGGKEKGVDLIKYKKIISSYIFFWCINQYSNQFFWILIESKIFEASIQLKRKNKVDFDYLDVKFFFFEKCSTFELGDRFATISPFIELLFILFFIIASTALFAETISWKVSTI